MDEDILDVEEPTDAELAAIARGGIRTEVPVTRTGEVVEIVRDSDGNIVRVTKHQKGKTADPRAVGPSPNVEQKPL